MQTDIKRELIRKNRFYLKEFWRIFFCTESVCAIWKTEFYSKMLPYSEMNVGVSWVSLRFSESVIIMILCCQHDGDYFRHLFSAWFTRWHVMRFTWLANQIWRGRGGQWHAFLQSVSHYIEISFKRSVLA